MGPRWWKGVEVVVVEPGMGLRVDLWVYWRHRKLSRRTSMGTRPVGVSKGLSKVPLVKLSFESYSGKEFWEVTDALRGVPFRYRVSMSQTVLGWVSRKVLSGRYEKRSKVDEVLVVGETCTCAFRVWRSPETVNFRGPGLRGPGILTDRRTHSEMVSLVRASKRDRMWQQKKYRW